MNIYSKMNFLYISILFLNIFLLVKSSQDYTFITANEDEVIHVDGLETVKFYGKIKVIYLDDEVYQINSYSLYKTDLMILYTFSNEFIEEDGEEYTNYKNYYELEVGKEYNIPFYENYLLFLGNGYVSFGGRNYLTLSLDKIEAFTLPYNLNNKYYILNGKGNTLEVSSTSNLIEVYINNYDNKCVQKCMVSSTDVVNVVNWYDAKKETVKLLYVNRKEKYIVDLEKGDNIKYFFNQIFKFEIKSTLSTSYFNMDEGILAVYGKATLYFSDVQYSIIQDYSTYSLYYIKPYANPITFEAHTTGSIGSNNEITIKGLNPTISIAFPDIWKQKITKGFGPQYLRISINSKINDEFLFEFGTTVNWFEGKMFTDQGTLNKGQSKTNVKISKANAGKTYTAIYNSDSGIFKVTKIFNWTELKEYEYKQFEINEGEEKAFKYSKSGTSSTLIKFEKGFSGSDITMYVYNNIDKITYDAINRQYSGYIDKKTSWENQLVYNYGEIYLILKSNKYYTDYISFRNKDITLKNDVPQQFSQFNDFNFIGYLLEVETGINVLEFLTNENIFTISLYQNQNRLNVCNQISCRFEFNKENTYKYYVYISNIEKKARKTITKLSILHYQKLDYYPISINQFSPKSFLLPFEFQYKLDSNLLTNINSNKEFVLNLRGPLLTTYNIKINYNNDDSFKIKQEKIDNYNYYHYYFSLINQNNINDLIITVSGSWEQSLFLSSEQIALTYGGPFRIQFPEAISLPITKNFIGNIIYLTIKNNKNINDKYLFSMKTSAKALIGQLFDNNGELNTNKKNIKKYMLNNEFFEDYTYITMEYNGNTNLEIYYEKISGEIIENRIYNYYKTYNLNFENNDIIYYLGFYEGRIDTYAYADNLDNKIVISYKDDYSGLYPVLPNENNHKLDSSFFPLNTQYNLIKFSWNDKNTNKYNKEFIIFNPDLTKEDLDYSKQGLFYVRKDAQKTINLKINEEEKDIYRVITKSLNSEVNLNIYQNNEYQLNKTNRYTNIWEVKKGEKFSYEANSDTHSLLFSKVLEGSIYKQFELYNNSIITDEKANNIIFNLELLKNTTSYTIEITNNKKTKFYYTEYHIKKNEIELRRLTLPILNSERKVSEYNSNIVTVKILNPYYDNNLKDLDCYFALSYEQDFENPVENNNYEIKVIYNERIESNYTVIEKAYPFFFNKENYNTKYTLDKIENPSNLVLTFITYQLDIFKSYLTYENRDFKSFDLNKKYIQILLDKNIVNYIGEHQIEIKLQEGSELEEYSCVWFHYFYTNEIININDFENYNNKETLRITQNQRKISWKPVNKANIYELYISKDSPKNDLFENECYLTSLKDKKSPNIQIINITNTYYEFEDKTQTLYINVIAYETKYNMKIVYSSLNYNYKKKSYILFIVLISIGVIVLIGGIIAIILFLNKKKSDNNTNFGISMSEDLNINMNNDDK